VRRQLDTKLAVTAGIYFTHHSNLGMTKPNPGIDLLGVNVGWSGRSIDDATRPLSFTQSL
jgi:lipid A 3-O-deacylase